MFLSPKFGVLNPVFRSTKNVVLMFVSLKMCFLNFFINICVPKTFVLTNHSCVSKNDLLLFRSPKTFALIDLYFSKNVGLY